MRRCKNEKKNAEARTLTSPARILCIVWWWWWVVRLFSFLFGLRAQATTAASVTRHAPIPKGGAGLGCVCPCACGHAASRYRTNRRSTLIIWMHHAATVKP